MSTILPTLRRATASLVIVASTVLTTSLLSATPATAAAGPYIGSNAGYAHLREQPDPYSRSFGKFPNGRSVTMHCYFDAATSTFADYSSRRWFRVTPAGGPRGWMHSSLVESQSRVPRC